MPIEIVNAETFHVLVRYMNEENNVVMQKRIINFDDNAFVVKAISGLYQSNIANIRKHIAKIVDR